MNVDILINNGILLTMDPVRRIIDPGFVAIQDNRIIAVGEKGQQPHDLTADRVIDAAHHVVMPGLIDGHAHAGHGLVKNLGADQNLWSESVEKIYSTGSTEEFWFAEAQLSALERLKCGVTTGVSFLGGGDSVMRTDEPVYGSRHVEAVHAVGIRNFLAVGPRRPPFPHLYARWEKRLRRDLMITFDKQVETCESLIHQWHRYGDGQTHIMLMTPVARPGSAPDGSAELEDLKYQVNTVKDLKNRSSVLFAQDGHKRGTVQYAFEVLEQLEPGALLSHAIDLTAHEIEICRINDLRIVHNPSAIYSVMGRCPVPELLDAGVNVQLGSDGTAPDRSYDMFRHMFQAMHYHKTYYHDPSYLPAGKILEMVTIDAARGLGMEKELGSLEPGKRADIILVDMDKPHLYPLNMPAYRIAYFACGSDVDTVLVDGKILMEKRKVVSVDEHSILETAQRETDLMLDRTGLRPLLELPAEFWGHSKYSRPII
jgi:5-methylthioadenosine/S-adenosylhomocysteine deaminase